MPTPNFIVPLGWMLAIVGGIDQLAKFYKLSTITVYIVIVVGIIGIVYFLRIAYKRNIDGTFYYAKQRNVLIIGAAASFLILLLPASLLLYRSQIYPFFFEQRWVERALAEYLIIEKEINPSIETDISKSVSYLISIEKLIKSRQYEDAKHEIENLSKKNIKLAAVQALLKFDNARLMNENGKFISALDILNECLNDIKSNKGKFWDVLKIIALNAKAIVLSRQNEGIDSDNILTAYASACTEAEKLHIDKFYNQIKLNEITALKRIAAASKRIDDWEKWETQSLKTKSLLKYDDLRMTVLNNYINGLREWYSELIEDQTPALIKLKTELLNKHDRAVDDMIRCLFTSVDPETRRLFILNRILFDYFTRTPPAPFDYDSTCAELNQIKPSEGQDNYQYRAQYEQIQGLLDLKANKEEGVSHLVKAYNIWHEVKNYQKEREIIRDLLDYYKAHADKKFITIELAFRWAGLRLIQKAFDPNLSKEQYALIQDVLLTLSEFGIKSDICNSSEPDSRIQIRIGNSTRVR